MDDVRKPRQRHRQRTGPRSDPSHFRGRWVGRSFWHVSDHVGLLLCVREFTEDHSS